MPSAVETPEMRDEVPVNPPEDQEDEWLVSCRCESAKPVATLLQCLKHLSDDEKRLSIQPVTVFCGPKALTFHVFGKSKQNCASVELPVSLFSNFKVAGGEGQHQDGSTDQEWQAGGEFCVNLTTLLECIYMMGSHALERMKLCFSYNLTQDILKLELLDNNGVMTTAAIPGMMPPDEDLDNELSTVFRSSPIAIRLMVKSDILLIMSELELVSGASCATVSLTQQSLDICTVGHSGECLLSLPCKGSHVVSLEIFPGHTATARTYPLHSMMAAFRGIDIAEETCIAINTNGVMAIQHRVVDEQLGDGTPHYVDFLMNCLEEEDEEEAEKASAFADEASAASSQPQFDSPRGGARPSRRRHYNKYSDGEEEDEEDDKSSCAPSASTSLFGNVVDDSFQSPEGNPQQRRRRRRRMLTESSSGSPTASPSLLEDSSTDESSQDESELVHHRRPSRSKRDEDCSSPEVVYGKDEDDFE